MRMNQVTVPATDIAASIAFYQALGLRLIVRSDHYARFECPDAAGGEPATFSLHLQDTPPGKDGVVVYFEEDDLDATVERLSKAGLTFEVLPTDQRWLWREAYLTDPSGNRVCLYRAGEARRFPPWRLQGS
ncbi:VOC family protein [Polyangium mundeleinium]|uniref:VOC family protein n=1 Tax=Polyangium mundeleinium TaxID=2995306 RepID=A0ABT5EMV7_9BACT|nr:VOC family protein [Polyangium mundeleinium]MDC0743076.1 VOC family protein [Polyangium mundeleinium]